MVKKLANLPDSASLIPLSYGSYAIVDTADLRILNLYRWCMNVTLQGKRYARRTQGRKTIYMHRALMNPPEGMEVDHINGNGLDNRRKNLRVCTKAEYQQNSKKRTGKSSCFKGVCWDSSGRKWRSRITVKGRQLQIGQFESELEAAEAYDEEAFYYFGTFARTNFKDANNGTKNDSEHTIRRRMIC